MSGSSGLFALLLVLVVLACSVETRAQFLPPYFDSPTPIPGYDDWRHSLFVTYRSFLIFSAGNAYDQSTSLYIYDTRLYSTAPTVRTYAFPNAANRSMTVLNDKLYIWGGQNAYTSSSSSVYVVPLSPTYGFPLTSYDYDTITPDDAFFLESPEAHVMAAWPEAQRLYFYGGFTSSVAASIGAAVPLFRLSLASEEEKHQGWQLVSSVQSYGPSALKHHSGCVRRTREGALLWYIFGGAVWSVENLMQTPLDDLWVLNFGTETWTQVFKTGAETAWPAARYMHAAVTSPNNLHMFVHGGRGVSQTLGDLWGFDFDTESWTHISEAYYTYGHHLGATIHQPYAGFSFVQLHLFNPDVSGALIYSSNTGVTTYSCDDAVVTPEDDCDNNGLSDFCELNIYLSGSDCNYNDIHDACELDPTSTDCDHNGMLDECQPVQVICSRGGSDPREVEDSSLKPMLIIVFAVCISVFGLAAVVIGGFMLWAQLRPSA